MEMVGDRQYEEQAAEGISQSDYKWRHISNMTDIEVFPSELAKLTYHSYHAQLRFCSSNVRAVRVGQRRTDSVDLLGSF